MRSCSSEILKAWYGLLNAAVSYDGTVIPVYRITAEPNSNSHYILLASGSETNDSTNSYFGKQYLLRVTIVTRHFDEVNDEIVDSIDTQINQLLFPGGWNSTAIKSTANFQVVHIEAQSSNYVASIDGQNRYYVKETIYLHKVIGE